MPTQYLGVLLHTMATRPVPIHSSIWPPISPFEPAPVPTGLHSDTHGLTLAQQSAIERSGFAGRRSLRCSNSPVSVSTNAIC